MDNNFIGKVQVEDTSTHSPTVILDGDHANLTVGGMATGFVQHGQPVPALDLSQSLQTIPYIEMREREKYH